MPEINLLGWGTVLAVLLLRTCFSRRFPRRVLVLLWGAALGILLAPGALSSPFSIYGILSAAEPASPGFAASPGTGAALWPLLRRGISGLALGVLGVSYALSLLRLHRAGPAQASAVRDWQAAHPLLRPLRICVGRVSSPVCGGVLLPRILLPEDTDFSDREALDCILTHEYLHVCRFDPLFKLLCAVGLCLRWYDPPVWLLVLLAGRDLEYACDEAVLDTGICPKRYAAVLLRAALRRAEQMPATARLNAGRLERRVDRVTAHRSPSGLRWAGAVLLGLAALLVFGTAPGARAADLSPAPDRTVSVRTPPPEAGPHRILLPDPEKAEAYDALRAQWQQGALNMADPYRELRLLEEKRRIPFSQVRAVMDELQQQVGPRYVRVSDDGSFYTVQVYTDSD